MKLLSRRMIIPKAYEGVYQILKSSAYHFPPAKFSEKTFSIHCAKRYKGGVISLIPVKGAIMQNSHLTEVLISIHADFGFYLGCLLILLGFLGIFLCIVIPSDRWIPCVGLVLMGLLVCGQSIWEGKALLDSFEHKLLR